jgi:putative ABC transport system permease protein
MWADVKYTMRSLAAQPLFYTVVILTLALGVGANAAIFTVVNAVLLRPLPYPDPDRLMMVWTYNPRQGFDKDVATYPNFEDWRRGSQSFERMSAYFGASVTLTGSGDPVQIRGARVTHEFFDTMQVRAANASFCFHTVCGRAGSAPIRPRSDVRLRSTGYRTQCSG